MRCEAVNEDGQSCELQAGHSYPKHQANLRIGSSGPCIEWPQAGEADGRHKLWPNEERIWRRVKKEPNTREDWEDLNATITAYRRRFMQRHTK